MYSKKLRMAGSSATDKVLAHYKDERTKERKERLTHYFTLTGRNNDHFHTPIDEVAELLEKLKEERKIPKYGLFLDAGSGDARIVALAAAIRLGALGAEHDEDLYLLGESNLTYLQTMGAIDCDVVGLTAGDFTEESTYEQTGQKFSDFGTIFHSSIRKPHDGLVRRVADRAATGTKLVSVNHLSEPEKIYCLKRESTQAIRDTGPTIYAHVYKKRRK